MSSGMNFTGNQTRRCLCRRAPRPRYGGTSNAPGRRLPSSGFPWRTGRDAPMARAEILARALLGSHAESAGSPSPPRLCETAGVGSCSTCAASMLSTRGQAPTACFGKAQMGGSDPNAVIIAEACKVFSQEVLSQSSRWHQSWRGLSTQIQIVRFALFFFK